MVDGRPLWRIECGKVVLYRLAGSAWFGHRSGDGGKEDNIVSLFVIFLTLRSGGDAEYHTIR